MPAMAILSPQLVVHAHKIYYRMRKIVEMAKYVVQLITSTLAHANDSVEGTRPAPMPQQGSIAKLYGVVVGVGRYKKAHYNSKPMSGCYAIIFAMQICKETKAFGFSPYKGQLVSNHRNHYFDDVEAVTTHHSFDLAYEMLRLISTYPAAPVNLTLMA